MATPIYERKGFKEYRKAKQERDAQIAEIKDSADICVMCKEEGTGLSDDNGSPLCDKCFHEIYAVCGECGGITQDREFQIFGCVHCARVIPLNEMRDALDSFRKSANEICELWELMPGDLMHDKEVNSRYPFKESFDDIIIQIAGWTEGAQERINSYLKEGK